MALKATIFKVSLQISDMDRHYYQPHELTIARHPSENDARMMVRLIAFALNAEEHLSFTKGISSDEEPDLWEVDLSGTIQHWIELGNPDEKRLRKACGRAKKVTVYCYNKRSAEQWWLQSQSELKRFKNLSVILMPEEFVASVAGMAERNMELQVTIQDGELWVADGEQNLHLIPEFFKAGNGNG